MLGYRLQNLSSLVYQKNDQNGLPGNVGHLGVVHVEELVPLLVLQLHDVKHALHTLQAKIEHFSED